MNAIEFYTTPEGEVTIKEHGKPERQLSDADKDFIAWILSVLETFYPAAYKALMETYAKSEANKQWRDFLAVRRFIKCNFGLYDNKVDIDEEGNFHFEFVPCPLRGECKGCGVICQPQFNSVLSNSELNVMRLCYFGKSDNEISDLLFISPGTVKNHRKNSFRKLDIHSMPEFMRYAHTNNLFK